MHTHQAAAVRSFPLFVALTFWCERIKSIHMRKILQNFTGNSVAVGVKLRQTHRQMEQRCGVVKAPLKPSLSA